MQSTTLFVEKSLYPSQTLLKAAYAFIDSYYIHMEENETKWVINLCAKDGTDADEHRIKERFENELISQTVRLCVYQQTHNIREMLLARAMSSAMIVEDIPEKQLIHEESDISDEELNDILTNWFDKNG